MINYPHLPKVSMKVLTFSSTHLLKEIGHIKPIDPRPMRRMFTGLSEEGLLATI